MFCSPLNKVSDQIILSSLLLDKEFTFRFSPLVSFSSIIYDFMLRLEASFTIPIY